MIITIEADCATEIRSSTPNAVYAWGGVGTRTPSLAMSAASTTIVNVLCANRTNYQRELRCVAYGALVLVGKGM